MTLPNTVFLDACRRRPVPYTPVWLMRQAGRYLPEYRALRQSNRMLEMCQIPELAAEVTLQPLRRFKLDASILFSDITVPFLGMGVPFDIAPGIGPVLETPIRTQEAIAALPSSSVCDNLSFVAGAISILKRELSVPLIGFAGAPFTLATYLIEGRPSRDFKTVRRLMYAQPELWHALMEKLTTITIDYLTMQAKAGVDALQVFDSWVGVLPRTTYQEAVFPYMERIFKSLKPLSLPLIHFGVGTSHLLAQLRACGSDVVGVDSTVDIRVARATDLNDCAIQGNLDPALLFAPFERIQREVDRILDEAGMASGHIFNLGHGVLQETPIDSVARLVDYVHERSAR